MVVKCRLAWWYKAKFPSCDIPLECIIADLTIVDNNFYGKSKASANAVWVAPHPGFIKLNVDGAMSCTGLGGGIGGILCDENGSTFSFSEQIENGPPFPAELVALKVGICRWHIVKEVSILVVSNGILIRAIPRSANVIADELAKQGVG
ncbi:hypothetical protein V6N11_039267 [Hibiscus sabdariffa]|uniref:RNase H type-1 domain-containing protein n=1 Tax=Hibiscus sabdariffa TaxID=183260 RepID=A0ABR2SMG2_9ROSI